MTLANEILLSVIVPVYNGEKYIKRIVQMIMNQSLKNLELIFIENNSSDGTYKICKMYEKKYPWIIAYHNREKGTSFARKKGIELAKGKYIYTFDQDDCLLDSYSLENMVNTIIKSNAEICEFSYYKNYGFNLKRKIKFVDKACDWTIEQTRKTEIKGIFEGGQYSPTVWTKIYLSCVLKDAIKYVNYPLFYGEDMFLNFCALHSNLVHKIHFDPTAYYLWRRGKGFSSKDNSDRVLMNDYSVTKPIIKSFLDDFESDFNVYLSMHTESLGFMKFYLFSSYKDAKNNHKKFFKEYEFVNSLSHIQMAKEYISMLSLQDITEDLEYLSSDFTADDFILHYSSEIKDYLNPLNKITLVKNTIKKLLQNEC